MIVGSIKEDFKIEKRVSITPETAKNIIGLGLEVIIEKDFAVHLGIQNKDYEKVGVQIKETSNEILNSCNLLLKVNCPSAEETTKIKENTILIGMLNPAKNKDQINDIIKKNVKVFSLELFRITRAQSMEVLSSQSNLADTELLLIVLLSLKKLYP